MPLSAAAPQHRRAGAASMAHPFEVPQGRMQDGIVAAHPLVV